ncbi:sugar ABC transporter substrate-binding protein [uncultured Sphaerochaeta sp.]|uniref:ABC transporter substrate-binding protein n=1 Tax=uncultured Sphaerochaeta sp. TaxID=886478 RepID=UPI002A0A3454|nr:sugar ABC transporter substrate-binding protein [uncultured Sphaerochaeta sp.]
MKKILCLFVVFLLCFSVFANGKQETSGPVGGDNPVEITYVTSGAGQWEDKLNPIFAEYERTHNVKVNLECYQQEQLFQNLEVKLGSKSSEYDVIGVDVPMVAGYVTRGYLEPMDQYFTAEEKEGFIPSAINAGTWDGKFYCPPMNTSSQLLWYNTDYVKQAGIEIPPNDVNHRLTWFQVMDMAQKVQKAVDPDGTKGIAGLMFEQVGRIYQILALPNSLGAPSIGPDGVTVEGIVDSPEWIKALEFYKSTFDSGVSLRGISADEVGNNFRSGKVCFLIGGTWNEASADQVGFTSLAYCPCPAFKGYEDTVATPTGSWHFGVSSFSKHKAEAAEFIKYMSLGEGNTLWLAANGDIPSTQAGINAIIENPDAPKYLKIAAFEAAHTAVPRPVTPGYSEYETIINAMLEDIRNGAEVKPAVADAIKQLNTALYKYKK